MNSRVKAVRLALGLSQDEFGKKLGLTRGAITNIELNKVDVKPNFADLLCSIFNVNGLWLRTGEGEMFLELSRADEIAAYVGRVLKDESAFYQQKLLLFLYFGGTAGELPDQQTPLAAIQLEKVADEILANDKKEQKD